MSTRRPLQPSTDQWADEVRAQLAAMALLARHLAARGDAGDPLSLDTEDDTEQAEGVRQLSPQAFARVDLLMLAESTTIPWTVGRGDMVRLEPPRALSHREPLEPP